MKNIKNIIEQKNPPENPNVLWLKDGTLYKSTSKGWVPLNESPNITETYSQGKSSISYTGSDGNQHLIELHEDLSQDTADIINDTFVPDDNDNIVFTDNHQQEYTLITEDSLNAILSNGTVVPITWLHLKDLRDNNTLVPGNLYRITDYNCTTTQEDTRSAGNQFDIVLLALSANKLAEEGWAMMNESNVYDVTFGDGVTKKCYVYTDDDVINVVDVDTKLGYDAEPTEITIDDTNKTVDMHSISYVDMVVENLTYNYFQNSNLSAWKVWYCLDNDTTRFAWADNNTPQIYDDGNQLWLIRDASKDIQGKFAWYNSDDNMLVVTNTQTPKVGDVYYSVVNGAIVEDYPGAIDDIKGFGRGVIYRLIDEFNNDVAYDFKSIQFVRPLTDGEYNESGTDTWVYTFNGWDVDNQAVYDLSLTFEYANNNFVGSPLPDSFALADVVFISSSSSSSSSSSNCTLNNTTYVRLVACEGAIINAANSDYLYCDDTLVTTDADDPAIYINNKKVLTET